MAPFLFGGYCSFTTFTIIMKKPRKETVTIKVTKQTVKNLNIASGLSGKPQYEVAEEGSEFVAGKYMAKQK